MNSTHLALPDRSSKPRCSGFTMAIDNGLPFNYFCDLMESASEHVDFVKFGWGTSVVTAHVEKKISFLPSEGVQFYLGGPLFEKYILQNRFQQYRELLRDF